VNAEVVTRHFGDCWDIDVSGELYYIDFKGKRVVGPDGMEYNIDVWQEEWGVNLSELDFYDARLSR